MKRMLRLLAVTACVAGVLGGFFVPDPAEARSQLVVKEVKWMNRPASRTAVPNLPYDTTYVTLGTAYPCTSMAISIRDLIIPNYPQYVGASTGAGDSSWTIARAIFIADSTATGTVTSIQIKVDGLIEAAGNTSINEPGNAVAAIVDTFSTSNMVANRVYSIPIKLTHAHFSTPGNAAGTEAAASAKNLLFFPNIRIIATSQSGTAGSVRLKLVHYADVP